jgi:hypothetical protein
MMVQILLFLFILLFSLPADAAYKIYLTNGSVISGVSSYEKKSGEVTIFFGGGAMGIPEKDILKIEDTEAPEKDFRTPGVQGGQEDTAPAATAIETGNRSERRGVLQAQLDAVNSEIQAVEEEEARVVKAINDRKGVRLTYNTLQMRQLESDLAPLRQELSDMQVKKGGLLQRKSSIEGELQSLQ